MEKKRPAARKNQNPIGPIDKPKGEKAAGMNNDTRVVYSEEHNLKDG